MSDHPSEIRREYLDRPLRRSALDTNAHGQFSTWLQEAIDCPCLDPTAFVLATTGNAGPDARVVLLKGHAGEQMVFYTDCSSAKGEQIKQSDEVCMVFHWRELDRQVRVQGRAERLDEGTEQEYFASRPLGSRKAAVASRQSQPVANREALERAVIEQEDDPVKPERWGGYAVVPHTFEFWQGRAGRLHDRFRYVRDGESWRITRLQP